MRDLQELFETMGSKEFADLSALMDKKNLNPKSAEKIFEYISDAYCAEKSVEEAEVNETEMDKLYNDFCISVSLWQNILIGHMEITEGRMMLTNGDCKFAMTPKGTKHVEENILK